MNLTLVRVTFLLGLVLGSPVALAFDRGAKAPDWAEKMVGHWHGEGLRTEISSGRKTRVTVEVNAEWRSELALPAVVSRNQLKEELLDSDGKATQVREYDRVYWIREVSRQGGRADILLGGGENSSVNPSSSGAYDSMNQLLIIQQDMGLGTRVQSRSDLSQDGVTIYQEIFWYNGRKKTFSEIRYDIQP